MKKITFTLIVAAAMIGFSIGANAQSDAKVTSNAVTSTATLVEPITISGTGTLSFGDVIVKAGTITVSAAGSRTATGTGLLSTSNAGTISVPTFDVGGAANYSYSIELPTSVELSDGATSPTTITVNAFTTTAASSPVLDVNGSDSFDVGGTLTLAGTEPAGTYTNTTDLKVTVFYN